MSDMFENKKFGVEHALNLYALSFVCMPAFAIYDTEMLSSMREQIQTCHIYLIGLVPKIELLGAKQHGAELITSFIILDENYKLRWPMPEKTFLAGQGKTGWYVIDEQGRKSFPSADMIMSRLSREQNAVDFKILYIGQAFGEDGSRNALDRLKKHETLQKIAVQGVSPGYDLTLLLLEIEPGNRMITLFNPWAKDKEQGDERISKGLDKLFDTNDAERTTLYEASLIRYFQPRFNKEFKNNFPSTNMKLLADCYKKDLSAVVAEICFDEMPFRLFSDTVKAQEYHIAHHNLHSNADREMFFSNSSKDF